MDLKIANGEEEASSSDAMPIDDAAMETEVEGPTPKIGVCHTCYVQKMQEGGQQVIVDLSSPILVT
jgi:hypothetical protein